MNHAALDAVDFPHSLDIGHLLDVDQILQRRASAQADAVPAPKAVFADGQRTVYLVAVFLAHELQVAWLNEFEVGQQVKLLSPARFLPSSPRPYSTPRILFFNLFSVSL